MSKTFDQWYDKHRHDIQEWANSSSYQNIARQAWDAADAVSADVIAALMKERDDLQVAFDSAHRERVFCQIHMGRNADLYSAEKEKVRVLKAALKAEDDILRGYDSGSLKGIDLIIERLRADEQRHNALKFCERNEKV